MNVPSQRHRRHSAPRTVRLAWLALLLAAAQVGCSGDGGGTPTDPGRAMTLTASPPQLARHGTSALAATARRSDGQPVAAGLTITFTTSLGAVSPASAPTDAQGTARATLQGDGTMGTANLTARLASDGTSAQLAVPVVSGVSLAMSANPTAIPLDGTAILTIQAREANGTPAAGLAVSLTTTLGRLGDPQPTTNSGGVAETTLNGGTTSGRAAVTAEVGGSTGPARVEVSIGEGITLRISAAPPALSTSGSSAISVAAFQASGTPVPAGTIVEVATTLGDLDVTRPATDASGLARTTLRADGRTGDARVTATTAGGVAEVSVVVPIR